MYILDIAPFENAFRRYYYFFVGDHTLFPIRTLDTVHIILHERCLFCIHTVKATHRLYPHFTITNYSLGSEFHWKKIQHFFSTRTQQFSDNRFQSFRSVCVFFFSFLFLLLPLLDCVFHFICQKIILFNTPKFELFVSKFHCKF